VFLSQNQQRTGLLVESFTGVEAGACACRSSGFFYGLVGRGSWQPIYELPYNYWHGLKGLSMPYTLQAITAEGTETFSPQHDNPMFATLTYRL
jgi:hypothetical protein